MPFRDSKLTRLLSDSLGEPTLTSTLAPIRTRALTSALALTFPYPVPPLLALALAPPRSPPDLHPISTQAGGNAQTVLCACLGPSLHHYDESFCTLLLVRVRIRVRVRVRVRVLGLTLTLALTLTLKP